MGFVPTQRAYRLKKTLFKSPSTLIIKVNCLPLSRNSRHLLSLCLWTWGHSGIFGQRPSKTQESLVLQNTHFAFTNSTTLQTCIVNHWSFHTSYFEKAFRFILVTNYGNKTEWSPIRYVIIRVIIKVGRPRSGSPICLFASWLIKFSLVVVTFLYTLTLYRIGTIVFGTILVL